MSGPLHARRWSLLTRVTWLTLLLTVLLTALVGLVADAALHRDARASEADRVARSVRAALQPALTDADLTRPLTPARRAQLDRLVQATVAADPDRAGAVLWSRAGAVYATGPVLRRPDRDDDDELARALAGRLTATDKQPGQTEIGLSRAGLSRVLEVYVPLTVRGRVLGAFEIYHDAGPAHRRMVAVERTVLTSLGAGLALLLAVLLLVVRGASRQLTRQSRALAEARSRAEVARLQNDIVAVVSHELRTPLTGLVGFSELLLDDDVPASDRRDWTRMLHAGARRLQDLVDELLDVSRLQAGRLDLSREPVDLAGVVQAAVQALGPLPAGLELVDRVGTGRPPHRAPLPAVDADPSRLLQVVSNLLSNAVKYSPAGGQVLVDADVIGDRVSLRVRDEGLGIPAHELPRVFDRFHRIDDEVRRSIQGSGLGLWIAREVVALHGGELTVHSPGAGLGTTVRVLLPAEPGGRPAPGTRLRPAARVTSRGSLVTP